VRGALHALSSGGIPLTPTLSPLRFAFAGRGSRPSASRARNDSPLIRAGAARALAPLAGRGRKTRPTISIRVRGTRRKRSLTFHAARHARWPLTPTLSPQAARGSTPSAGKEHTEHAAGLRPHLLALRRLGRRQVAGERLRHAFDQGEHVGMLFRPPARERIGKTRAPRRDHAIAHACAERREFKLAVLLLLGDAARTQRAQWRFELALRDLELGAERRKRQRRALAQSRQHPKLGRGQLDARAGGDIG